MLSGITTIVLMLLFVGCWVWAWRPSNKPHFDAAARLVFDDEAPAQAGAHTNKNAIEKGAR